MSEFTTAPRMSLEDEYALSFYQPVADLSPGHPITLVQHQSTHRLYVRKDLTVFNEAVYRTLQQHPLPGLPPIQLLVRDGDRLIVIEEYISGSTLSDRLAQGGAFREADCARLMQRICETVQSLHRLTPPIIHRDLKPSNIMLSQDGSVWLIDMNAAKFADVYVSSPSGTAPPKDTFLIGTQGYAAPEQYGFGVSTPQTDIYALGVLYRTLLTGDPNSSAPLLKSAARIIARATMIDPQKRYGSLDVMIRDLSILSGLPVDGKKPVRFPYAPPGFRHMIFWRELLASLYYIPMIFIGLFMTWPDRSAGYIWFNRLSFIFIFLLIPFVSFNYGGILDKIKVTKIRPLFLRLLVILVIDVLLFLICTWLVSLIENIFV